VMFEYGFNNYAEEWWHFTLQNEPFSADQNSSYFDFEIE
jgi:D-alanyl-D-alanine dipeptidase